MGTSKQSVIEVNGKRYDARTGQLITEARPVHANKPAAKPQRLVHDFARTPSGTSSNIHKKIQPSKTLMRDGVKRPAVRPAVKNTASRTVSDFRPVRPAAKGKSAAAGADAQRQARASTIKQSNLVRKFNNLSAALPSVTTSLAPLAVRPAPATAHGAVPQKSPAHSMIERGLRNATSHNEKFEPKPKRHTKKRSRLATYSAGALAALLLVGFVAYQNVPNIAVRYAAVRSGVQASLPGYQPAGFALGSHIQYNPGQITLNYSSNADERGFTITQRESNWNSDALMSNYVASKSEQVQTYEDKGRTIYLYGESSATWISGGVWYDIDGKSQLNSDQLIRIATSM